MEPTSQISDVDIAKTVLEGQLRNCYGRVVYSHKTHEKCADILLERLSRIKLWQIILSATTAGGFFAIIFGSGKIGALAGILISTLLLTLNSYTKNYDLGELAQKHRQAASDLWFIREEYLSLLTDLKAGKSVEAIQTERDSLLKELHSVYLGALSTNYKAYKKAQGALKLLEDLTFTDEEIDAFLPKELKKGL